MPESWITASREPSLDELFAEPIVQMLMQRDGIRPQQMQSQLHHRANGAGQHKRRI